MIITSRTNPLITEICALKDRKKREESGLFFFEGRKLLTEALASPKLNISRILLTAEAAESFPTLPTDKVTLVSDSVADKLSQVGTHDGVFCTAFCQEDLHRPFASAVPNGGRALMLSSVRDPGNLGTIIRTAYAFGIDHLVLTDDCADLYNPKTVRAAMGMLFRQKILRTENPITAINAMMQNGFAVYATALSESSKPLTEIEDDDSLCFVLGNEGHGLSEEVIHACSGSVIIPMAPSAESLNVSSAAAVLCWELFKGAVVKDGGIANIRNV